MPSALTDFFDARPVQGEFAVKALKAAVEIAREEGLDIELENYTITGQLRDQPRLGWHSLDEPINRNGWANFTTYNLKNDLERVIADWTANRHGVFFRGSKMPDATMGSFGFSEDGVHLSPYLAVAQGYAGYANSETGIGNLLRLNKRRNGDNYSRVPSLGFVSVWKLPYETLVWKNFQYEDSNGIPGPNQMRIEDVVGRMQEIASLPPSAYQGINDLRSEADVKVHNLFINEAYEVVSGKDDYPSEQFLQFDDRVHAHLIRIDPQNPSWDHWMARVQEANLRDFYEILPLEAIFKHLESMRKDGKVFYGNETAFHDLEIAVKAELEDVMNRPWYCKTMQEARQLSAEMPWLAQSKKVGSSSGQHILPPHIQELGRQLQAVFTPGAVHRGVMSEAAAILSGGVTLRRDDGAICDDAERLQAAQKYLAEEGYSFSQEQLTDALEQTKHLVDPGRLYSDERNYAIRDILFDLDERYRLMRPAIPTQTQPTLPQESAAAVLDIEGIKEEQLNPDIQDNKIPAVPVNAVGGVFSVGMRFIGKIFLGVPKSALGISEHATDKVGGVKLPMANKQPFLRLLKITKATRPEIRPVSTKAANQKPARRKNLQQSM